MRYKNYRTGPASHEETEKIRKLVSKTVQNDHQTSMKDINQYLLQFGVRLNPDGLYSIQKPGDRFPVFQTPEELNEGLQGQAAIYGNEETELIKGIKDILSKGPKALKKTLDRYVIGQEEVKKVLLLM